ncbi:MAG TPA: DUF2231 domain-containing protein [Allosphingosinicella sp.]|nr:DUF2231 domain-containing protein [Allosphingosinicella sp.]
MRVLVIILILVCSVPAEAHKEHQKAREAAAKAEAAKTVAHPMSPAVHEAVKEDLERMEAEVAKPWHARLADWVGRIHPFSVHFPLALFPIAWVALILGRRRQQSEPLVRSIVIVAGASSAAAAVLGWLNGGFSFADADPILAWHRWIGTGLGLVGLAVATFSWRNPASAYSRAMVWVLGLVTLASLVQGWLGGALVHGVDHLNW